MSEIMDFDKTHYSVRQKIGDPGPISIRSMFPLHPVTSKRPESPYGAKQKKKCRKSSVSVFRPRVLVNGPFLAHGRGGVVGMGGWNCSNLRWSATHVYLFTRNISYSKHIPKPPQARPKKLDPKNWTHGDPMGPHGDPWGPMGPPAVRFLQN